MKCTCGNESFLILEDSYFVKCSKCNKEYYLNIVVTVIDKKFSFKEINR